MGLLHQSIKRVNTARVFLFILSWVTNYIVENTKPRMLDYIVILENPIGPIIQYYAFSAK